MLKRIFAITITISVLLALGACSRPAEDTIVPTESEVVTTVDTTEDTSEVGTTEFETEAQAQKPGESELISDEEAINLAKSGHNTVLGWLKCNVSPNFKAGEPIYRNFGNVETAAFYPISRNAYAIMRDTYGRGSKIYYGNYDTMQKELSTLFTRKFIDTYFTYGDPFPFIYENDTVYFMYKDTPGFSPNDAKEYTVIHKTEDEVAVICEVYNYDWNTWSMDYSKISSLGYIKFVKSERNWLIDECYGYGDYFYVHPRDLIPSEYTDNVPEKYLDMTEYFVGYTPALSDNFSPQDFSNPLIYEGEPPLSHHELTMPVPDFLDLEQQILYRKAYSVYRHNWGSDTKDIEYDETLDNYEGMPEIIKLEKGFLVTSNGRYRNWDDYIELMLSVFTENFYNDKNAGYHYEQAGKLVYFEFTKGGNPFKANYVPDDFELVSKSDTEIIFNVIGHYSDERDLSPDKPDEWTEKFPIRMVMTESGWRFDEFYSTAFG